MQKVHSGRSVLLLPITDELFWHIFQLHHQGTVVLSHIVFHKASELCHDFWEKSERAKANVSFRWLKNHSLKYHMGTHEMQRSPVEFAAVALVFMQHIHPKVSEQNSNPKFIINMDQTPIFFTCYSKKTLEWKGTKSVNIWHKKSHSGFICVCRWFKVASNAYLQGTQRSDCKKRTPRSSNWL